MMTSGGERGTNDPASGGAAPGDRPSADPAGPVLVFDSGVGGLSVARAIRAELPGLAIRYVADLAGFPYGDWDPQRLTSHCVALIGDLARAQPPCAVVIACNTASTLILPPLRAALDVPVVGTVPAIKPAAASTRTGVVAVLATPGTVRRDYTFDLIAQFAPDVAITLVGARRLARLAEEHMAGHPPDPAALAAEIAPCFVEKNGRRTDVIVLACTHYPLLLPELQAVAPWPVAWIDPAPAIARRLAGVLGPVAGAAASGSAPRVADSVVSTDGRDLAELFVRLVGSARGA